MCRALGPPEGDPGRSNSCAVEVPEGKDNISVKMHYTNEAEIKDTLTWATPLKLAEITLIFDFEFVGLNSRIHIQLK